MRSKTEAAVFMPIRHHPTGWRHLFGGQVREGAAEPSVTGGPGSVADLVDDGQPNDSLGLAEESVSVPAAAGRHAYTHTTITAPDGSSIVEAYRVQDMGHAWPGPDSDGRYTDHASPDASAIVWEFAERHPMR
jgi:poly(3-hydroxybutyrate) depolymerase